MKLFPEMATSLTRIHTSRRNLQLLGVLFLATIALVIIYSALFQLIMKYEGQKHSWVTAFYWTTTNMSTLGLGDIAFRGDLGRAFTIVVHGSGLIILLALIPFLFIRLFQSSARAPRHLPSTTRGHVILSHYDPLSRALMKQLKRYRYPYVFIFEDLREALNLHDEGVRVVHGDLHNPDIFRDVCVEQALLVASTAVDEVNTNVAYTVREVTQKVPVITTASTIDAAEIHRTAGSSYVLMLAEMMGQALARRILGADAMAHVVGQVDDLLIAEAMAARTPLVGKSLRETRFREIAGSTIVGAWERGEFKTVGPETIITNSTVLMLTGSQSDIDRYNELFCIYHATDAPVIIVGAGRVGHAMGNSLALRGIPHVFIEEIPGRVEDGKNVVVGSAQNKKILDTAGFPGAPAITITTHDDDTNIFLTTYFRQLRPDIQISSRATHETNVRTLHRAGADFVISYASMGANAIFNYLRGGNVVMLTEGLNVFKVKTLSSLVGKTLRTSSIRKSTGCSVIAINNDGVLTINPDPDTPLGPKSEMILIATAEAEERFLKRYWSTKAFLN